MKTKKAQKIIASFIRKHEKKKADSTRRIIEHLCQDEAIVKTTFTFPSGKVKVFHWGFNDQTLNQMGREDEILDLYLNNLSNLSKEEGGVLDVEY